MKPGNHRQVPLKDLLSTQKAWTIILSIGAVVSIIVLMSAFGKDEHRLVVDLNGKTILSQVVEGKAECLKQKDSLERSMGIKGRVTAYWIHCRKELRKRV